MERSWNPISKTFLLPRPPFHPCNPGAFLSSRHNSKACTRQPLFGTGEHCCATAVTRRTMIQFSLLALTLGCAGSTLAFAPASRALPSLRAASATSPHALRSAGTFISAQQERPRLSLMKTNAAALKMEATMEGRHWPKIIQGGMGVQVRASNCFAAVAIAQELSRFAQQNCFVRYRACQESFRSNRFSFIQAAPRTEFA